jgi:hypothetical protein
MMFGFGGSKSFNQKVWSILSEISASSLLPQLPPLNAEIEKFRLNKFSEHSAVLLLCYSSAMSIALGSGDMERAQKLYDKARDNQDHWIRMRYVDATDARGFNKHISENSKIIVRL